jgi:hypothetical protein
MQNDEEIRRRAYELFRERGGTAGDDWSDWLRAEREFRERGTEAASPGPPEENAPPAS